MSPHQHLVEEGVYKCSLRRLPGTWPPSKFTIAGLRYRRAASGEHSLLPTLLCAAAATSSSPSAPSTTLPPPRIRHCPPSVQIRKG